MDAPSTTNKGLLKDFHLRELVFLALCSAMVVGVKSIVRLDLQVPGNTGVLWMAVFVVAKHLVPRFGAAGIVGLVAGLIATLFGMGKEGMFVWVKYFLPGLVLDLFWPLAVRIKRPSWRGIAVGVAAGLAHLGKLGASFVVGAILGVPRTFLVLGLGPAAVLHAVFGFLGGVLGQIIGVRLYHLIRHTSVRRQTSSS